jgi:hypothetical protein
MGDPVLKRAMLQIARAYEVLARRTDAKSRADPPPSDRIITDAPLPRYSLTPARSQAQRPSARHPAERPDKALKDALPDLTLTRESSNGQG